MFFQSGKVLNSYCKVSKESTYQTIFGACVFHCSQSTNLSYLGQSEQPDSHCVVFTSNRFLIYFGIILLPFIWSHSLSPSVPPLPGKKNKLRVYYLSWLRNRILHNDPEVEKKQGWITVGELEGCVHYKVGKDLCVCVFSLKLKIYYFLFLLNKCILCNTQNFTHSCTSCFFFYRDLSSFKKLKIMFITVGYIQRVSLSKLKNQDLWLKH